MTGQPGSTDVRPWARALLGSVLAGALVLGFGSRVVMRVIAILAGPGHSGESTIGGNIVGRITVGGSIGMLVPGALGGAVAGGIYLVARRWLPRRPVLRGLWFGSLTIAVFGSFLIGDGTDFRFTTPGIQVAMYAAVFLLFGLVGAASAERLGKGACPSHVQRPWATWSSEPSRSPV